MIKYQTVRHIVSHLLDKRNYPLLVHCDLGRHRTGVVVGALRKMQGWHLTPIISEYVQFTKNTPQLLDIRFLERFTMDPSVLATSELPDWFPVPDSPQNKEGTVNSLSKTTETKYD